ncbi:hypothetical protein DYB32_003775 [Aphanomyces invadans]|uniref:PH domain-containing protein n=1 Tax=Aphanomyces invadans TaxID=157072 RepID=A0A3R6YAN9_9STRA|nr:hypothetical protein DYB32_003775 [Aphanomyces invadans]
MSMPQGPSGGNGPPSSMMGGGGNLIYSGWLVKQGKIWKSWKKRYFVLLTRSNTTTGEPYSTLQYYKSHRFAQLKGEIALDDPNTTVRYMDIRKSKREHCFELIRGFNSLVCQAKDDDDCKQWVEHLSRVLEGSTNRGLLDMTKSSSGIPSVGAAAVMTRSISAANVLSTAPQQQQLQYHPWNRHSALHADPITRLANELRKILVRLDRGLTHLTWFFFLPLQSSDYAKTSPEANKCLHFVKHFDSRSTHAFSTLQEFISTMCAQVQAKYGVALRACVDDGDDDLDDLDDDVEDRDMMLAQLVDNCIHRQVEQALFLPLHDGLYSAIRRQVNGELEASLNKKLRWLQGKDQAFFDISPHQLSPSEWRDACKLLGHLGSYSLPIDKYNALVEAVDEIQATYSDEHPMSEFVYQVTSDGLGFNSLVPTSTSQSTLDTDDLIPIFTFMLVNSGLENLLTLKHLLTAMQPKHEKKQHPSGTSINVLGILGAAMEFVQNVTIPAVLEDIFKEQIAFSIDGDWRLGLGFEAESTYRCGAMVKNITAHGQAALGGIVSKGHVLVTLNGTNVVLWPYNDVVSLLNMSTPPHRMAFISNPNYVKILGSNKSLWNVALLQACQRGAVGSVQMLLANGAEVNYISDNDLTPLSVAVSYFHVNVVSYLLQHGAKTKQLTALGRGPLHLLGAPLSIDTQQPTSKQTQAPPVAWPDKVRQIIHKLVRHGAVIDGVDHFGYTPLMLLASTGCLEGVDTLMELSKTINIDLRGWHTGCSALACAAKEGQSEVATALLDYGADPSVKALRGETPLHYAASAADLQTCAVLLSEGKADVNARTLDGWTPLMLAVSRGALIQGQVVQKDTAAVLDTVRLLINEQANPRDICNVYRQAIHYAALYGGPEVYGYLVTHPDVDVHAPDLSGKSARQLFEAQHSTAPPLSAAANPMLKQESNTNLNVSPSNAGMVMLDSALAMSSSSSSSSMILSESPDFHAAVHRHPTHDDVIGAPEATPPNDTSMSTGDCKDIEAVAAPDLLPTFLHYRNTSVEDIEAFFWSGHLHVDKADILAFFRLLQESSSPPMDVCFEISNLVIQMLPSIVDSDAVVLQWLTTRNIAPFVKACQMRQPFSPHGHCDAEYAALAAYFDHARPLAFLSDSSSTPSSSAPPNPSVRDRLAFASTSTADTRNGLPQPPPVVVAQAKRRFSILDRVARLWYDAALISRFVTRCRQLDIDPGLMASQITLLQHWFFQKIPGTPVPMVDVNPPLAQLSSVQVAGKCLTPLRNFDGFVAIMYALNDSSIFRLKKTWGRLPPPVRTLWQELKQWTEKGARPLHKLMKEGALPSIPYLGLIAQQFIVAQEYPDFVQNDLVNLKKMRLRGNVVRLVLPCQKTPYIFTPDKRLLDHMCAPLQLSTKDLCFNRSLEVEPRLADVE